MASRALAFSHPDVIALATRQFIPVAENCSYLQRQRDAKGEFFRLVAEQGHYSGRTQPSGTRQGIYACTAEGRLLASINTRQAEPMLGMLNNALRKWREEPGDIARSEPLVAYAPDPRSPRGCPEGGLVLKVYTRDLPRTPDTRPDDWRRDAVNYDHAWFTREEAESLLLPDAVVGARHPVPPAIVRRLARFHLLDTARGETPMWRDEEVRHGEMTAEVTAVSTGSVDLCLEGAVQNIACGTWAVHPFVEPLAETERGFDCRLQGYITYDRSRARFVRFDLLAVGMRWGGSEHNMRRDDLDPAPLGVAFELAGSEPADRTPPQGSYSDYWGAPGP